MMRKNFSASIVLYSQEPGFRIPHLGEASPAILTINQCDECGHDRTPLLIADAMLRLHSFRRFSRDDRNGFFARQFGFVGLVREASSHDREVSALAALPA
jgi:hypothetical protein